MKAVTATFTKRMNKTVKIVFTILFIAISLYGVYAFVKRGIGDYLLMKVMFAFFDLDESRVSFLLDYASVMVLIANVGFYIQSGMLRINKRKEGRKK